MRRLSAGMLGGLGPVAAPLQQQRVQEGLRPVRAVVQAAVKRVMEARPQGRVVPALGGHGHVLGGGRGLRRADRGSLGDLG